MKKRNPERDERLREEPAAATRPAPKARSGAAGPPERSERRERGSAPGGVGFGRWMGAMWLYTVLRIGLFLALFGLLWLLGVTGFLGAIIALALSLPLSYVLLAKPRQAFAALIEQRIEARRARQADLDAKLSGDED
jgi:hypothetical protein